VALHDNCIVVTNGDRGGSECNVASGITELANGEKRLSGKLQDHMAMASCSREAREFEVCLMGGM